MHVLFAGQTADAADWVPALQARLQGVTVSAWDPAAPATGADIALVWKPPATLFEHERSLKVIFNLGAGVDALLAMDALPADVRIVRLEDAGMSDQIAEYVVFALARIARGFDGYQHAQAAQRWQPRAGSLREDWPVGVLGLGAVGTKVARILSELGYPVAGWSRTPRQIGGVATVSGQDQLPAFLKRTRVLVNILPLTPSTKGILDRALLAQLMPGAHLINVGRGDHLNEDDLAALLDSGQMSGATLDVFQTEPLPNAHPFWRDARIYVTPHIAGCTLFEQTVDQIGRKINLLRQGQPITGVVDRGRGY